MSTVDSILKLLEKWPAWKRITQSPDRLDELERRVAALESKLERAPGEACPACGGWTMRVKGTKPMPQFEELGVQLLDYACEACGFRIEKRAP